MNVISVIFLFASVFFALVNGLPAALVDETLSENDVPTLLDQAISTDDTEFEPAEPGTRFRRATCDLLSFKSKIISVNHSACAAHCLAKFKGYKGGRCKNGVCHCRK